MKAHKRRAFIKTSALGVLGLPDLKRWTIRHPAAGSGIELAIATICLDGFGDENFEPAFKIIPKTGIKNVEFNVWNARNLTPEGIASIQERCDQNGLKVISLQGTSFGGNVVKDVAHKMWLMEKAKELGCHRVKFTGSKRGEQGGLDTVINVLKELVPVAEELDILIAVENHANNNIENIEDYDQIFQSVDSPQVGMCLDMGHFDGAAVNNFTVIEKFHQKINHVDIKDTVRFGTYQTVPYGSGVTDGEGIVQKLIDHGYTGYLVIEQAPPQAGIELVSEIKRIKSIFEKFEK